jgi:hypothetical protein
MPGVWKVHDSGADAGDIWRFPAQGLVECVGEYAPLLARVTLPAPVERRG